MKSLADRSPWNLGLPEPGPVRFLWESEEELGFLDVFGFPAAVLNALRSGPAAAAVHLAVKLGFRDENKLTNLIFFARHPERGGRKLEKSEPGFQALSREWLEIRDRIVRPVFGRTAPSKPLPAGAEEIFYTVVPGEEYGSKWRSQRPPGLPATARQASGRFAALPHIERLARAQGLGETFVQTVGYLAQTESHARFGLPANIFDARPQVQRKPGKPLITAWGAFQFNRDAWRSLPGVAKTAFPWDSTPWEEIARPVTRYAQLFRDVLAAGGSQIDAARGIRLWHAVPAVFKSYLKAGRSSDFERAWQNVSAERRSLIDRRLRSSGVPS
jgi:hypothetical protein